MDAQRERFVKGCAENSNIPKAKANELFDLIDKFAGYGFNKSHAAAYALLAYHTAWLKAHYPGRILRRINGYDIHLTDKLTVFVDDMRRTGITCLPPDINVRRPTFRSKPCRARRRKTPFRLCRPLSLGGLKGVGEKAMEVLVEERDRTARSSRSTILPTGSSRACSTGWQLESLAQRAGSTASTPTGQACMPRRKRSSLSPPAMRSARQRQAAVAG